jgi:hypothetical protein
MAPLLKRYYPGNHRLFQRILGIQDADMDTLIGKVRQTSPNDSLEYMTQVFVAISQLLEKPLSSTDEAKVKLLNGYQIFPLQNQSYLPDFCFFRTALDSDDEWYIADRLHFRRFFEGKLSLLAFDEQSLEKMQPLIQILDLSNRLLSRASKAAPMANGQIMFQPMYTNSLQKKANWIAR